MRREWEKLQMETSKVSIIIPIYNMAEWIGQAIEGAEKQTLKELEIICVDDGSTDRSLEVLREYAQKYDNIKVISQPNLGAGPARNRGIDEACGEYLAFLDADDYYYSEDALEYLYKKAKENNASICRGSSCDDRDGVISFKGLRPERSFAKEGFVSKECFPGPTGYWAGIYNREFLNSSSIRFPNLRRGQDAVFSTEAIAKAGKVYCLDKVVYVYRKEHKTVIYSEEKAVDALRTNYAILRTASKYGMSAISSQWKNEIFGEPGAMLYKFAAAGNKQMQELAVKINALIGGGLLEGDEIIHYVDQVKADKPHVLDRLKKRDAVYVFGAGTIGRKVSAWLLGNGITPEAIIVSDLGQNPSTLEGIPVKPIETIDRSLNYEVIIATFWYMQNAIIQTLKEHGVDQITPIDLCTFHLWQDEIVH